LLKVAKRLKGIQTASSISRILNVNKRTAINYVWRLRKEGYLTTDYGRRKIRLYRVSLLHKEKRGYSFYELLNKNSKVKLSVKEDYIIHSEKEPSVEEILVMGVKSKEFRTVLASLGLFNKIKDWSKLKFFADKYGLGREIGALYDVARISMRVRKMDNRTRRGLRKGKRGFIIENIKSKDFKDIERGWKVHVPFNKQDLEVYKE